ncbi:MAG TPA: hypothetical protein VIV11_24770 [Kofleriaceae bacterium]
MRALVALALLAGCINTNTVTCADGTTCGADHTCVSIDINGATQTFCATPDQLAQCEGKQDGDACDRPDAPGSCHAGVCLISTCGNFLRDANELCDDGNNVSGDSCSADCASDERCGNGFVDVGAGEQCDVDDVLGHDGCSSDCRHIEVPGWLQLTAVRPQRRDDAGAAYDARRHRFVLFGGVLTAPLNDTNEWDGDVWQRPTLDVSPSLRAGPAMAYDAARQQIVLFSGTNGAPDTWIYDGRWRLRTSPNIPPQRAFGRMAYDEARKQTVLFGGRDTSGMSGVDLNDTWIWDGQDWREVTTMPSPPKLLFPAFAYDPARGVSVLFGGTVGATRSRSIWEFDGTTWTDRTPASGGPTAREKVVMAYDPVGGGMIVVGGPTVALAREVWRWDGSTWTALPSFSSDTEEYAAAIATDPVRGRVVLYAGKNETLIPGQSRIYEWDGVAWSAPSKASGTPPSPGLRIGASMALDPLHGQIVMIGGGSNDLSQTADTGTWVWRGEWALKPGMVPSPRRGAALAYDEVRRQFVAYGGCTWNGFADSALAETWIWDGVSANWSLVNVAIGGLPGTRCNAGLAFDAARGQIVLFGGSSSAMLVGTTWTWDGATWTAATPAMSPSPREPGAMAYDRVNRKIVLFGGRVSGRVESDTWTWDGQTWESIPIVVHPAARNEAVMAWDASRARLVLTGGGTRFMGYVYSDTWEWDGITWSQVATNGLARRRAAMASAPDGAGVIMFGGGDHFEPGLNDPVAGFGDTWRLRWDANTAYELCTDADTDGDGAIGCADPDCSWACTPLCPPNTSCAMNLPGCGDGMLNTSLERCYVCPQDAMPCTARCGDFICQSSESQSSCPGDCTP